MLVLACVTPAMLVLTCWTKRSNAQTSAAELTFDTKGPFQFIVYGDSPLFRRLQSTSIVGYSFYSFSYSL